MYFNQIFHSNYDEFKIKIGNDLFIWELTKTVFL